MTPLNSKMVMQQEHEAHEEPWLISYADLMTLLFGFFVILYSFSTIDERKLSSLGNEVSKTFGAKTNKNAKVSSQLDEERLMRAMTMMASMSGDNATPEVIIDRIEQSFIESESKDETTKALGNAPKDFGKDFEKFFAPKQKLGEDQIIKIVLPSTLLFQPNTSSLTTDSLKLVENLARKLSAKVGVLKVEVVGHSDIRPMRLQYGMDNWGLAAARASAVAKVLTSNGIPTKQISVISKGDQEPLFPSVDQRGKWIEDNLSRNRRVEIVVHKQR